jgi:hypothetical protein
VECLVPDLEIENEPQLLEVLRLFTALDEIRWGCDRSEDLINSAVADLSPDEKLLTHWLCYIMDRQMPFQRIWDVGGYIISALVRDYSRERTAVSEVVSQYYERFNENSQWRVRMLCGLAAPNDRLLRHGVSGQSVGFASRYMPDDLALIIRTLMFLDRLSDRSFIRFLRIVWDVEQAPRDAIEAIAAGLDLLTYSDATRVSAAGLPETLARTADAVAASALVRKGPQQAAREWAHSFRRFEKKRLWCPLRDYLKCIEFNDAAQAALRPLDQATAGLWARGSTWSGVAVRALELPGDVWNNNLAFWHGLFLPHLKVSDPEINSPNLARQMYKALHDPEEVGFYPERLDVSFDFVPNMCSRRRCQVCPFGAGVAPLCHQQSGLLCPVVMVSCGYYHPCNPDACSIRLDSAKGTCATA